jgi:hypothetical protein
MNFRYNTDKETGLPHIYDHGVSEEEVERVVLRPSEFRKGSRDNFVVIGQTRGGRYLRVIYLRDPEPESVFIITAYEIDGPTLAAFKKRMRRRSRR